jgi:zinc protease
LEFIIPQSPAEYEGSFMKRIVSASLLLAILMVMPAHAQKYGISSQFLDNGLEVIVIENPAVPLVTIEIVVKNGGYTEPPELDGLSHLYEHMFFKANKNIPQQEAFLERTRELGMVWNGTTSQERVNYYFTLHKDFLDDGMEFMRDAIRYPLFLQEELVRERPVVTGEFDRNEASPFFHWQNAMSRLMWHKYWSRKNVIGDREVILTATEAKMRKIQNRYYVPNNSAILIAGDVNPRQAFAMAEKWLGDWPRGNDPFVEFPVPEHPPLDSSSQVTVIQPVNAITIGVQWHGPKMLEDIKSTFAADVFSFAISQPNSRFQQMLVDSGLVDFAGLGYQTLVHTGPISLNARCSADRYERAMAAIQNEVAHFADDDYVTDEQIEYAKNQLEIGEIQGQEQTSNFVHTVSYWWSTGGLDYYLNYLDNLRAVKRSDIQGYVKRYIIGKYNVTGILASQEDAESLGLAGGM